MNDSQRRNEVLSKLVLVRLDPILRALLSVVQLYQTDLQKPLRPEQRQKQMELLRNQTDLLHRLDQELQSLPTVTAPLTGSLGLARTLEPLLDYVTLPLLAIIRGTGLDWSQPADDDGTSAILQSSQWKTVQVASLLYRRHIPLGTQAADCATKQEQQQQHMVKVLLACAVALPSGRLIEQQQETAHQGTRLDRGNACLLALLELIEFVVAASGLTGNGSCSEAIAKAMDGALVARIADTCVTILKTKTQQPDTVVLSAANSTLQMLIKSICSKEIWRQCFPGCYGGLYQSLLTKLRATSVASRLAADLVRTLTLLLDRTLLVTVKPELDATIADQPLQQLQFKLQDLALTANDGNNVSASNSSSRNATLPSTNNGSESEDSVFFYEVRTRLSSPMMVLIRQLAAVRASSVRQAATDLYRVLLMTTDMPCWTDSDVSPAASMSGVIQTTLDSCMILTQDSDATVSTAATKVMDHYSAARPDAAPIETIVSLMEELPVLVRSHRPMELRQRIKLLSAYLAMSMSSKALYSRLCVGGLVNFCRNTFSSVCDLDFESFHEHFSSPLAMICPTDVSCRPKSPSSRFLDDETQEAMTNCLRLLGKALGSKYVSLLVDSCIADAYESLNLRLERGSSSTGTSQIAWLHEWIGVMVFISNLFQGAFCADVQVSEKQRRKREKILENLAMSVSPILMSNLLLDLPSSWRIQNDDSSDPESIPHAVASALHGNAAFIFVVLELFGCLCLALGNSCVRFVPTTLFAILEKTSWFNAPSVQNMAMYVLNQVALCCDLSGPKALIVSNLDILLGSMNARLRIPGGRMVPFQFKIDKNVIVVAMAASALLRNLCFDHYALLPTSSTQNAGNFLEFPAASSVSEMTTHSHTSDTDISGFKLSQERHQETKGDHSSIWPQIQLLLRNLLKRFDQQATNLTEKKIEANIFLEFFDAILCYLFVSNNVDNSLSAPEKETATCFDWRAIMKPMEKDLTENLSPAEGFTLHRNGTQSATLDPEGLDRSLLSGQIACVSDILTRSCYLLAHPDLKIQVSSAAVTTRGFQFLGWVAKHVPEKDDESNGPTTAILRQVHSHWPSISARLKATSSNLAMSERSNSYTLLLTVSDGAATASSKPNVAELRVFLSQLFILAGVMCENAGDFMSRHYRDVIYPGMAKVVASLLPPATEVRLKSRPLSAAAAPHRPIRPPYASEVHRTLMESEQGLMLGVFRCLSLVYGHRPMGLAVASLIPSTGSMVLPFLEQETLYQTGMDALKKMICIDSDSLYRHLLKVCQQPIPLAPWQDPPLRHPRLSNSSNVQSLPTGALELTARSLLEFIDALPEQSFD